MTKEEIQKSFERRWRFNEKTINEIENWYIGGRPIDLIEKFKSLCRDFFEAGLALGQRDAFKPKDKTVLEVRALKFCRSLNTTENILTYGAPMLKAFYDYWSEPNPSHTKMRFELQKTWDLDRRLARWARNNYNNYGTVNKPDNDSRRDKLASVLTP